MKTKREHLEAFLTSIREQNAVNGAFLIADQGEVLLKQTIGLADFRNGRMLTAEGNYEAVNYHRFADDMLITVSGHSSKRGWAELALQRLHEQLKPLGVELNLEKTRMVNALKGDAFTFLGFDLRRVQNRSKSGYFILMTPKKKACIAVKARIREVIQNGGAKPAKDIVKQLNGILAGSYYEINQKELVDLIIRTGRLTWKHFSHTSVPCYGNIRLDL